MINTKPIDYNEFNLILKKKNFLFEKKPHIAICVSGGVDSLALLILMNKWIKKKKGLLTVLHFNHKLRDDSKKEEFFVKNICSQLKVIFKAFSWNVPRQKSSIMKNARDARYKKFIEYCSKEGIISLMTAHHRDDCLETYLMRKKRGYATLGLNAIPTQNIQKNLQILRPLIDICKKRLINTCKKNNLNWISDPSNENNKYERAKVRKYISSLNQNCFKNINVDFRNSQIENTKTEKKLSDFLINNLSFFDYGKFVLKKDKLLANCQSLQIEVVKRILVTCSGTIYPPKTLSVKSLVRKIKIKDKFIFSLNWCIINVKPDLIEFYREYQKIKRYCSTKTILKKNKSFLWDNRFVIETFKNDLTCEAMNEKKWLFIKKKYKSVSCKRQIHFDVIKTLPIIKVKNKLIIPYFLNQSELEKNSVRVLFNPIIPLTKKNFLNIN